MEPLSNKINLEQIQIPQVAENKAGLTQKLKNTALLISGVACYIFSVIISPYTVLKNYLFGEKKLIPILINTENNLNDESSEESSSNSIAADIDKLTHSLPDLNLQKQAPGSENSLEKTDEANKTQEPSNQEKDTDISEKGPEKGIETDNQKKDASNEKDIVKNKIDPMQLLNALIVQNKKNVAIKEGIFEKIAANPPQKYKENEIPTWGGLLPNWFNISGVKWLNDDHIYAFFILMANEFPIFAKPEYFHAFELDTDYAKKNFFDRIVADGHFDNNYSVCKHDLKCLEKKIFAYPIHVTKNHWTLVLIDRTKRTVEYYDSKKNYGNYGTIIESLEELTKKLNECDKGHPDLKEYTLIKKVVKNIQPDTYECGIWTCYHLEQRLKNPDFPFESLDIDDSQVKIKNFRLYMMDKLIKNIKHLNQLIHLKLHPEQEILV